MEKFKKAHSLSEMVEESGIQPVIVFKYSSICGSSTRIGKVLEQAVLNKTLPYPIFLLVVQDKPALSENIAKHFDIQHESPQIIILRNGKVTYTANHNTIKIENFVFKQA